MQAIGFYLSLPFIYLLSILPYRVLMIFSDILYFIVYHVIRYRRAVVYKNLRNSFPEKSDQEIRIITRKFYHSLADTFMETIKSITMSKKSILDRCDFKNLDLVDRYVEQKKNVLLVCGHYSNWEWTGAWMGLSGGKEVVAAFKPLKNPYFNNLMFKSRSKFKLKLIPKRLLLKYLETNRSENRQTTLILISDQSPNPKEHHWVKFLNQDTAVVTGMEKIARQYNYTVIFASINPITRGYYSVKFTVLTEDPASLPPQALTKMFMEKLEADIIANPAPYLWSHRRWKLKKPD